VLGDAWSANLDALRDGGLFDLVCMTGDLAFSGQAHEYAAVTDFLDAMLQRLGLPRDRLFVVPGNHDVHRDTEQDAWRTLRGLVNHDEAPAFSRWLAGGKPPRGVGHDLHDTVLRRQAAQRAWLADLGRDALLPARSPHGRLGYRATLRLPGHPFNIHVIGLDSAWLAGDDADARHLWLTEDQVMRLAADERGAPLSGFRLALVHHPLTDLADGEHCRRLLASPAAGAGPLVDLLLRGHLHETEPELWADPQRTLRQLAAGCLYEHDRYPNACVALTLTLDPAGRPVRGHLRLRAWSARGHWHDDASLYPAGSSFEWFAPPPRPRPAPRPRVFVGREAELAELARLVDHGPVAVCAVQGMPGVGKSHLVDHFTGLHAAAFPGGYLRLVLEPGDTRTAEALRDTLRDQLALTAPAPDAWQLLAERLRTPRTLVHVENTDSREVAATVARLVQHLRDCALVITGRYRDLGRAAGWARIEVAPFDERAALHQLDVEIGPARDPAERDARRALVHALGGLPLALHLAAGYLAAGHTVERFMEKLRGARLDLRPRDPADPVLDQGEARAILRSTFDISLDHLRSTLAHDGDPGPQMAGLAALGLAPAAGVGPSLGAAMTGLTPGDYEDLVVEVRSLSLLDPVSDRPGAARMHLLLAEHVRTGAPHDAVVARMTAWFVERLPRHEHEQGRRWGELHAEHAALVAWLASVPPADCARVQRAGGVYAWRCGPYLAWVDFCERCLQVATDDEDRSTVLGTLGFMAERAGEFDRALAAARDKARLDQARGAERDAALARGQIADILHIRGDLDEALHILRDELLPVFERLGDDRSHAVTWSRIAGLLHHDRGELDEALRILRHDVLPVYERLGDDRSRAVTLGNIVNILRTRGDLEEALRILRHDVLPDFERLGDVHSRAATMGTIADILRTRGELEEALHILCEDVLPVFERLGARPDLVLGRAKLAQLCLDRQAPGDRERAAGLLRQALADARVMRIPEAGMIEVFMLEHGIDP
jgi:3',5'-cyclic AMP phosphodiesterase CpdA/tetratricopeptide (TPR) repeat protein